MKAYILSLLAREARIRSDIPSWSLGNQVII